MQTSEAELRELVRSLVVAALKRLESEDSGVAAPTDRSATAPPASRATSPRLLLLFMSREPVPEQFYSELAGLSSQGYSFAACFSRSFEQSYQSGEILKRLPKDTSRIPGTATELDLLQFGRHCSAILAPSVSIGTAAKVTVGIEDSLPSLLMRDALLSGLPVLIARDLPALERELSERHSSAAPSLLRATMDTLHRLQSAGVRFVPPSRLAAEVTGLFIQPSNETPARLARTKPLPRRVFITAEDVYTAAASGHTELPHPPDAVITDAAREEAAARGIALTLRG